MGNTEFRKGTVIKGRDLRKHTLWKILSEDMIMYGFQYKMGMNEDVNPLAVEGSCGTGLHFCFAEDICKYLIYGTKLAVVSIPDDEDVYVDNGKFRAHRLIIEKVFCFNRVLDKPKGWECLILNDLGYIPRPLGRSN